MARPDEYSFQLSDFHGFAVVDFQTRKEVTRIKLPPLPPGKVEIHEGGNISHGMAVTADSKTLVVNSRQNSALYAYSLPDLKLLGGADVGLAPDWVTLTPDSKTAYVANAGSNSVSVIDLKSMKEVTRISCRAGAKEEHDGDAAGAVKCASRSGRRRNGRRSRHWCAMTIKDDLNPFQRNQPLLHHLINY